MPSSIDLESSTICQLKCRLCGLRKKIYYRGSVGAGFLKFEHFKEFINRNRFIKHIELSNNGEVFLNPELSKIIKYAYSEKVSLTAEYGVNFNTVSDEVLEALVKYKFEKISIAIDGASQETYSKYRIGGDFNRVIDNIRKLNTYKKKYESVYPKLWWQYVLMQSSEDVSEIKKAKDLAKELNMSIFFKLTYEKGYIPNNPDILIAETGLKYLNRETFTKNTKSLYANMCQSLWNKPYINWDGRLLGCCYVSQNDFGVNVFEIGIENALKSANYVYAKRLLSGKIAYKDYPIPSPTNGCKGQKRIPCLYCIRYKYIFENKSFINPKKL
ncbi:MAG: radical SAM protein [Endomicrobium sp.]|nr:radical SAM protein [Endomicrobium sp.]